MNFNVSRDNKRDEVVFNWNFMLFTSFIRFITKNFLFIIETAVLSRQLSTGSFSSKDGVSDQV